jgi:hypothetical protein
MQEKNRNSLKIVLDGSKTPKIVKKLKSGFGRFGGACIKNATTKIYFSQQV